MSRYENCILTNMCMIYDGERILVQNRNNPDWGGLAFPGGYVEPGESFVESVIREVKEETGFDIINVQLCGIKQWADKEKSYRYIVLFYKTNSFKGELHSSEEGEVFRIKKDELKTYKLADGFDGMLEVFNNDSLSENYHWFDNDRWQMRNI